jgi:hypothetical protein
MLGMRSGPSDPRDRSCWPIHTQTNFVGWSPMLPYRIAWVVCMLALAVGGLFSRVLAADAVVLGRDTPILQEPRSTGKVLKTVHPGESLELVGRKAGKAQPRYIIDEKGEIWVKVQVGADDVGFVRNDLVSVAREEYPSPRGTPILLVNLRSTADGTINRELWVVRENWRSTHLIGEIDGHPVWSSQGEWFVCEVDSERPVKDPAMDRTIERIEKIAANGRTRTLLATGTYPVLNEGRGEVYFYRDVDDRGDLVPPGLFAVSLDGTNLRPIYLLPERWKFWREDGDFFIEVPPPVLSANRIAFYAYEPHGTRVRITVTLDGQFQELRRD